MWRLQEFRTKIITVLHHIPKYCILVYQHCYMLSFVWEIKSGSMSVIRWLLTVTLTDLLFWPKNAWLRAVTSSQFFSRPVRIIEQDSLKVRDNGRFIVWILQGLSELCNRSAGFHFILQEIVIRNRTRWPRGVRRGSVVSCFLGLWVRIPPGA